MKILLSQIFITGTVITDNILEPPCSVFTNVFTSEHELWDLEQRWERNYVNHGSWEMWSLWHGSPEEIISEYICSEDLKYTRLSLVLLHYGQFSVKRSCGGLEYDRHLWHCLLLLLLLHLTQFLPLCKGTLVRWFMLWRLVLGASETWNNFGWDSDKYSSWMKPVFGE